MKPGIVFKLLWLRNNILCRQLSQRIEFLTIAKNNNWLCFKEANYVLLWTFVLSVINLLIAIEQCLNEDKKSECVFIFVESAMSKVVSELVHDGVAFDRPVLKNGWTV